MLHPGVATGSHCKVVTQTQLIIEIIKKDTTAVDNFNL